MLKIKYCFIFLSLFGATNLLLGMTNSEVDDIIVKIEKAVDPENVSKTIKTSVQKAELEMPAQNIKMNITVTNKFPNKSRVKTELPGVMTILRVFNGVDGWEYSPVLGMRQIEGKELNSVKFDMAMQTPNNKMRDIFSKIEVPDKREKIGEFECYKFICTPKKKYNQSLIIMFIDTKKFLMRKMDLTVESQMGAIKTESIFSDYQKVNKMMVPMVTTMKQAGMDVKLKVLEIKNNAEVNDSEFDKPASD